MQAHLVSLVVLAVTRHVRHGEAAVEAVNLHALACRTVLRIQCSRFGGFSP